MKAIFLLPFAVGALTLYSTCFAAAELAPPATPQWAENVHNLMLETAFPQDNLDCLFQMDVGSRIADSARYQAKQFSYMHAMKMKGESDASANKKYWDYIDGHYAEIRLLEKDRRTQDACYLRGMALHAVMDSTSPAHRNTDGHFKEWDPMNLKELFKHGDLFKYIEPWIPVVGNPSQEDMNTIDQNPRLLQGTASLMRVIDEMGRNQN